MYLADCTFHAAVACAGDESLEVIIFSSMTLILEPLDKGELLLLCHGWYLK